MSTANREAFYAARDRRTVQYGGSTNALARPVAITVDPTVAVTRPGQIAVLSLIEMLARVHRRITVITRDCTLRTDSLTEAGTLLTAVTARATAIDPYIDIASIATTVPADTTILGIGATPPIPATVYVGWDGGAGILDTSPVPCRAEPAHLAGAATAACLGAAALFRLTHDLPVHPTRINLVERAEGPAAGASDLAGPIDVGDAVLIGAGAVTHALTYWARQFGVRGTWITVDGDVAELHNTNRCLGMTAADAGWPDGVPGGPPRYKADVAADLIVAQPVTMWFDEWLPTRRTRPDLQLCLANERGIRLAIARAGEPLLLHATTSPNWTAELHRHIPGRDDCPACRLPEATVASFACSTGPVIPADPASDDAALPFLSGTAGLMLAIALRQLPEATPLTTDDFNHWRLHFENKIQVRSSRHRPDRCRHVVPAAVRSAVQQREPRRWDHLDDQT